MALVTLKYEDLVAGKDLTEEVFRAFGPEGLGALTVSGIPNYAEMRERLLPMSYKLAHLPEERQKLLEHPPSMFNVGWSHGKEKLGDKPDYAKGSFYANPLYDEPGTPEEREKYPWALPINIWPTEDLPELEQAFKHLGRTMYEVVCLLTKQVDSLTAARVPGYKEGTLFGAMSQTQKAKGRMLYYYPVEKGEEDNWIGWHNDSGFLTALTSAMFFNDETGEIIANPDPNGGLYIVQRGTSGSVRVRIPADQLAIQCGECLQIVTGGLLVATPHAVRSSESPDPNLKIGRATMPVFIDVKPDFPLLMPEGSTRDQVFAQTATSKVPPLEERWLENGVSFGQFLGDTFMKYYEWSTKGASGQS